MNKPKITFIGFAHQLSEKKHWMQIAEDSGMDVTVLGYDHAGKERSIQKKWPYISLGSKENFDKAFRYRILFSLYSLFQEQLLKHHLKAIRPDIIHVVNIFQLLIAHRLCTTLQIPTITSTTGLGSIADILQANPNHYVRRRVFSACERGFVTFQNSDDMNMFINTGVLEESRASIVPGSGINTERFSPPASGNENQEVKQVTQIGTLSSEKGTDTFLEAASILQRRSDLHFVLCGHKSTTFPDSLLRDAKNVTWTGHVEDVVPALHASAVVNLSSKNREGMPRSLLEAQASGLPVVASDVPGNRQLVQNNYNGILVEPNNAHALASAIGSLADSPNDRINMGDRGRNIVLDTYSNEAVGKVHMKLYDSVLGS